MSRRVLSGLLTTGVIAASLFVAGPAFAHFDDSRLTLDVADHTLRERQRVVFFGTLHNEHPRCEARETIRLKRIRNGIVRTVRTTKTDANGEYRFVFNPARERGRWFTRYPGKGGFGYQNRHSCGADNSPIVRTRHA